MFYGNVLVGYAFTIGFLASCFFLHSRGIFFPVWMEAFEVDRTRISLVVSLVLFTGALLAPIIGYLIDRFPVKRIMGFGLLWLALGMAIMGVSVAGIVMPTVAAWLAANLGWQDTYLLYAAVAVLLMLPLTLVVVKQEPADVGAWTDGDQPPPAAPETAGRPPPPQVAQGTWATYREFLTSRVNGLFSFFLAPAMFWVLITGYIADSTGSYVTAFQIWAVAFALAGVVTFIVKLPNRADAVP